MTVLCPILCKRKLLITQRLKAKFLVPPTARGHLGGICVYTCTVTVHFSRDQPGHLPVCTDSTDIAQPIRDQLARTLTNQKPQKGDKHHHDHDTTRALYKGLSLTLSRVDISGLGQSDPTWKNLVLFILCDQSQNS